MSDEYAGKELDAFLEGKFAGMAEADAAWKATLDERLAEAEAKHLAESFTFEARVAALKVGLADPDLFADAEVARRLLGFDDIPVADGRVDRGAVESAVNVLVKAKPYLKPPEGNRWRSPEQGPRGLVQGPRGGGAYDFGWLETASPEEIVKAREDGLLDGLLEGRYRRP